MKRALLALTLVTAFGVQAKTCTWDNPGADPYMGSIQAAVDDYRHIPVSTRNKIKALMQAMTYEIVTIERDRIEGFDPELRGMHFGHGICDTTSRKGWKQAHIERALVYCADEHCIAVPFACRNVSLIRRLAARVEHDLTQAEILEIFAPLPAPAPPSGLQFTPAPDAESDFDPEPPETIFAAQPLPIQFGSPQGAIPAIPAPIPEPPTFALLLLGLLVFRLKS